MGEYRAKEWQGAATSVRDRMDCLYNNTDMADLHILAADEQWWWGQTVKDFTAHRLVLCAASPVFHQLFYPVDGGPEIPDCLSVSQSGSNNTTKVEIDGVPPIAVEALLEYCYKDRFDRSDYENGYSRNLLWRLWHAAKIFRVKHLFQLCTEALEVTMCDETVFWDLNYSLVYQEYGTDNIKKRVVTKIDNLGNHLYEHPNLVWLDTTAIREMLKTRAEGSSEPVIVLNNILRWALYQLDRNLCEEQDGKKDGDIPIQHRLRIIEQIKEGQVKDYGADDISKYLGRVLDLVPFTEMSQRDFFQYVMESCLLDKDSLIAASKGLMKKVIDNPDRLYKSLYMINTDPTTTLNPLGRSLTHLVQVTGQGHRQMDNLSTPTDLPTASLQIDNVKSANITSATSHQLENLSTPAVREVSISPCRQTETTSEESRFTTGSASLKTDRELNNKCVSDEQNQMSPTRSRPSIKSTLEQARLRRAQDINRKQTKEQSILVEQSANGDGLLLVE